MSGLGSGVFQVAAGGLHTCAVASGGLYCWGYNASGQLGKGDIASSNVPVLVLAAPAGFDALLFNPPDIGFSRQSRNTTSPSRAVTITNNGSTSVTITGVTLSSPDFAQTNICGALAPNASCVITATFTPTASGQRTGTIAVTTATQTFSVELTGAGENSLVAHYYRSILTRAPESGGRVFWEGEAARLAALGANASETYFAMANYFFNSPEYIAANKTNTAFMIDLYRTFFNRAADDGGLDYWVGQVAGGMPREVVLVSFMFSPEFASFTQAIFGNTAARTEIDTVVDFYRGLLSRLPDSAGFQYWVGQFRAAQCAGASAVYAQVEAISSAYTGSPEYAARNRDNAQFVGDMYNAFLRRGGVASEVGVLDQPAQRRRQGSQHRAGRLHRERRVRRTRERGDQRGVRPALRWRVGPGGDNGGSLISRIAMRPTPRLLLGAAICAMAAGCAPS